MNLGAIDPGLRYPAAARFENGKLVRASRVKIPTKLATLERGQRCLEVAKLIRDYLGSCDELVTEWPRTYRRMKGDPADLFPLAGVGMAVAGMMLVPVTAPTAPEWIGSIPKNEKGDPLESPRGHRVWSILDDAEKAVVVLSHDAIDAVGLGLFRLGRLELPRHFIGSSAG